MIDMGLSGTADESSPTEVCGGRWRLTGQWSAFCVCAGSLQCNNVIEGKLFGELDFSRFPRNPLKLDFKLIVFPEEFNAKRSRHPFIPSGTSDSLAVASSPSECSEINAKPEDATRM